MRKTLFKCAECGKPIGKWEVRCVGNMDVGDLELHLEDVVIHSDSYCVDCIKKALRNGHIYRGRIKPVEVWEGESLEGADQ